MTVPTEVNVGADEALRADIRRLGAQLGQALTRQHGEVLLDLVEEVRGHTKAVRIEGDTEADDLLAALLEKLDLATTIDLVRAFSAYFYLANVAEQTHRVGDLAGTEGERYLDETIDRIAKAGLDPQIIADVLSPAGSQARVHGSPDRGGPADDPDQAAASGRSSPGAARTDDDVARAGTDRSTDRGAHRPDLADRRTPGRTTRSRSTRPSR